MDASLRKNSEGQYELVTDDNRIIGVTHGDDEGERLSAARGIVNLAMSHGYTVQYEGDVNV
ncbi:hypothetical protein BpsM61_00027 [Bacillus phage vB_BpsM-61]|nr:hypothetical protein BpsM61_00027 [Bacillus phage vB_BpsM-61]